MFVLIAIRDTVPVTAKTLAISPAITIKDALNKKYANKLVPEKGLAMTVYDILTAEDGKVTWGNGVMYYKVSFRLMLFAPFIGEVIVGTVMSSCKAYIRISLDLFRDIYIIPSLLPPNSAFDTTNNQYYWVSSDNDRILTQAELFNTIVTDRLYIDVGTPIRFRVDSINWQDIRPVPNEGAGDHDIATPEKDPIEKAGFRILASIAESGLGLVSWWNSEGGEEEGEEGMEED